LQLAILALCFALVRGGERLNALAAAKWDEVFPRASSSSPSSPPSSSAPRRRTNYFDDESGVFWSALVSAPLLLVMAVQLASFRFSSFFFFFFFFFFLFVVSSFPLFSLFPLVRFLLTPPLEKERTHKNHNRSCTSASRGF
jgi:hypothetical protein